MTDATLLELEKTLREATAKYSANPFLNTSQMCNTSQVTASRDNCKLISDVMCKYDDDDGDTK